MTRMTATEAERDQVTRTHCLPQQVTRTCRPPRKVTRTRVSARTSERRGLGQQGLVQALSIAQPPPPAVAGGRPGALVRGVLFAPMPIRVSGLSPITHGPAGHRLAPRREEPAGSASFGASLWPGDVLGPQQPQVPVRPGGRNLGGWRGAAGLRRRGGGAAAALRSEWREPPRSCAGSSL